MFSFTRFNRFVCISLTLSSNFNKSPFGLCIAIILCHLLFNIENDYTQFPYANAKKLYKVDRDEFNKIIELNKSQFLKDAAYKKGIFVFEEDDLKLDYIRSLNSSSPDIELTNL